MDELFDLALPDPAGGVEDLVEYDRRRSTKDRLTEIVVETAVEMRRAVRALAVWTGDRTWVIEDGAEAWQAAAMDVECAAVCRDLAGVKARLPELVRRLTRETVLFVPLSDGGHPRQILKAKSILALLESLYHRLPRLGLIRETYQLVRLARKMETNAPRPGRKISEFDRLFPVAFGAAVETLVEAVARHAGAGATADAPLVDLLRPAAVSFQQLWVEHSNSLRLSAVEAVNDADDWGRFRSFIETYGRELFTAHFLTYGNVRGLLHRGVGAWLEAFEEDDAAPGRPERLLDDIADGTLDRAWAVHWLEIVLQTVSEHYEEYRDYNTTTTWSDYGENLYVLMDFLRLKVEYDRQAWRMRPLVQAHEILCRKGQTALAERWRKELADGAQDAAEGLLAKLAEREAEHAVRLRTVRDALEERFVQPLLLERLCSLVGPAMAEARADIADGPAFTMLMEQLRPLADTPTGVGLDVPHWVQRLSAEVEKVVRTRGSRTCRRPAATCWCRSTN